MTTLTDAGRRRRADPRLVVVTLWVAILVVGFWMGSRGPALTEKALMGGDTRLSALGFDPLLAVSEETPWPRRLVYNAVNWTATNAEGMAFGLLLGAALMMLLSLTRTRGFRSGFANALLGAVIGSPLGVCVNCATPIAHGLYASGGRLETMLAAMMSSPTLNVIVVTMMFSLLPWYMVGLKLGLTLAFILVVVPLLSRWLPVSKVPPTGRGAEVPATERWIPAMVRGAIQAPAPTDPAHGWGHAAVWFARQYPRHLWSVVRVTVPLMLLAGVLGSVVVTLVPFDSLAGLLPGRNPVRTAFQMIGVAGVGVLLPVPMAFDVIVAAVLFEAGLAAKYVMVLLFTLGIFSVYPFSLVWRTISRPLASVLVLALVGVGVGAGVGGHFLYERERVQQRHLAMEVFAQSDQGPTLWSGHGVANGAVDGPTDVLPPQAPARAWLDINATGLTVARTAFEPRVGGAGPLFARTPGPALGVAIPDTFPGLAGFQPWSFFRSIAAGDVHNDGWVDIVVASDAGLRLYANREGQRFLRQRIDIPVASQTLVSNVALVDLNNDGWLDLFFATFRRGNYVAYNTAGRFLPGDLVVLPNQADAMLTGATGFGDVERDGDLDVVLGNWAPPPHSEAYPPALKDVWLQNGPDGFVPRALSGFPGESLSVLLVDVNHDGHLDVLMGNDRETPDTYHLGDGQGRFSVVTQASGLFPYTTRSTMSLTSADIDNDLSPEIYAAQVADGDAVGRPPELLCTEASDPELHRQCLTLMDIEDTFLGADKDVARCAGLADASFYRDCVASSLVGAGIRGGDAASCDALPRSWDDLAYICRYIVRNRRPGALGAIRAAYAADGALIQANDLQANSLFTWQDGRYVDQAAALGVTIGGWAWNAKFADLNNDEWQDLYIVNNIPRVRRRASHYLYLNHAGRGFENAAAASGLTSYQPTPAYVYIDFDGDGDLDIVTVPHAGPSWVYRNTSMSGHSVAVELRDHIGNRFGVGSRITVHYGPDGSRHQMREILASGGFASFDAPVAYFGLGSFDQISRIEIDWSTGEHDEVTGDLGAGARYTVTRPGRDIVAP